MTVKFSSVEEIEARVGEELGPGEWLEVDQARVDLFAEATGDDQWIHVDPQRAEQSPFGTTIAHGYLTTSLIPLLTRSVYEWVGVTMGINYGSDTIRYPAPLPVGAKVRARATVRSVEPGPRGTQVVVEVVVESDRGERPVCVATTRTLVVF